MNERFDGTQKYFAADEPSTGGVDSTSPSVNIETAKTDEERLEEIKRELFTREMPPEYRRLIDGVKLIGSQAEYSENLMAEIGYVSEQEIGLNHINETGRFFANEVKDGVVVDLGCGQSSFINYFVGDAEVRLYIGIDLSPAIFPRKALSGSAPPMREHEIDFNLNEDSDKETKKFIMPELPKIRLQDNALQITGDMLENISQMKSQSVKLVILSGIEVADGSTNDEYVNALKQEIKRVLTKDGLVVDYHSDIYFNDLAVIETDEKISGLEIRKKQS